MFESKRIVDRRVFILDSASQGCVSQTFGMFWRVLDSSNQNKLTLTSEYLASDFETGIWLIGMTQNGRWISGVFSWEFLDFEFSYCFETVSGAVFGPTKWSDLWKLWISRSTGEQWKFDSGLSFLFQESQRNGSQKVCCRISQIENLCGDFGLDFLNSESPKIGWLGKFFLRTRSTDGSTEFMIDSSRLLSLPLKVWTAILAELHRLIDFSQDFWDTVVVLFRFR